MSFTNLLKRRYGPAIKLMPADNSISSVLPFVQQEYRPGEDYRFPVKMQHSHGVTHWADKSAATLNSVVSSDWKMANLEGAEILIADNIPYGIIAAMMQGKGGSYGTAVDQTVDALLEAGELYRELNMMYGGGTASTLLADIGVINASVSGADLNAGQVVNFTRQTWSAGIWNNLNGAYVDVYQTDGSTLRATECVVSNPDLSKNRITLTKSGSSAVVAGNDKVILRSSKAKSCVGIQGILENTGSLFGISAATYPQWQAVSQSASSGVLSIAIILRLCAKLKNNGASGGGTLCVNAAAFADIVDELNANERYLEPMATKTTGADAIRMRTPIGAVDLKVHTFMKQGLGFLLTNDNGRRVGSTDLTTGIGMSDEWFYHELDNAAGGQLRIYSNQAPVLQRPYHCGIITAIQSNADTTPS